MDDMRAFLHEGTQFFRVHYFWSMNAKLYSFIKLGESFRIVIKKIYYLWEKKNPFMIEGSPRGQMQH